MKIRVSIHTFPSSVIPEPFFLNSILWYKDSVVQESCKEGIQVEVD